jgi:signal transduction histidine kinase
VFSNARDAFETSNTQDKKISISRKCIDNILEIEICDSAGGIEEAILDRVFEPYFTTKEPDKGTGIGLYMSKTILQKSFNGDMKIENRYENGIRIGAKCTITINQQKGLPDGN